MPLDRPYDFLFVFHCNYVYIAQIPRYYCLFPKIWRCHVTVTTLTQGTVCSPNSKASHGEPVYKIWSLCR